MVRATIRLAPHLDAIQALQSAVEPDLNPRAMHSSAHAQSASAVARNGLETRALIALLRSSGKLCSANSGKSSRPSTANSSNDVASKEGVSDEAALLPLAVQAFTRIFLEFGSWHFLNMTGRVGIESVRVFCMDRSEFMRYRRESIFVPENAHLLGRGAAHAASEALLSLSEKHLTAVFHKFSALHPISCREGACVSASAPAAGAVKECDIAPFLGLSGFLAMHLEACASRPLEMLAQLRVLEYRHDFLHRDRLLGPAHERDVTDEPSQHHRPLWRRPPAVTPPVVLLEDLGSLQATLMRAVYSTRFASHALVVTSAPPGPEQSFPVQTSSSSAGVGGSSINTQGARDLSTLAVHAVTQSALERLLDSQAAWLQHPAHAAFSEFLNRFVKCRDQYHPVLHPPPATPAASAGLRDVGASSSPLSLGHRYRQEHPPVTTDVSSRGVPEEVRKDPAACLSLLFRRCMTEMGGGQLVRLPAPDDPSVRRA